MNARLEWQMDDVTRVEGPVELLDGKLTLMIPLDAGGAEFLDCSRGIGVVENEFLRVTIPDWLAAKLGIYEGTLVSVDNANGKFNLRVSDQNPKPN